MNWTQALTRLLALFGFILTVWIFSDQNFNLSAPVSAPIPAEGINPSVAGPITPPLSPPSQPSAGDLIAELKSRWPAEAIYLEGVRICIDPGHGGQAHRLNFKRGPTGFREAVANLRVALFLRDFLQKAGASVTLTRDRDVDLSLAKRAQIANDSSDLFLSIHHNASSNPSRNYTSVWYHAEIEHRPAAIDLGRHILTSLIDHLGLSPTPLLSTGLLSDYLIYPGQGFGVLRHLRIPGVLSECCFHSNPEEEKRLANLQYNKREAWGLFLGLVSYVAEGRPQAKLLQADRKQAVFSIDDGLIARGGWGSKPVRLFHSLTRVEAQRSDGTWTPTPFRLDLKSARLICPFAEDIHPRPNRLRVTIVNMHKHHNFPRIFELDP